MIILGARDCEIANRKFPNPLLRPRSVSLSGDFSLFLSQWFFSLGPVLPVSLSALLIPGSTPWKRLNSHRRISSPVEPERFHKFERHHSTCFTQVGREGSYLCGRWNDAMDSNSVCVCARDDAQSPGEWPLSVLFRGSYSLTPSTSTLGELGFCLLHDIYVSEWVGFFRGPCLTPAFIH